MQGSGSRTVRRAARVIFLGAWLLGPASASEWRDKGYLYLSPQPEAEFVAPQTTLLVRFEKISPWDLANLATFVRVEGATSGTHTGQTRIATDNRTVIFEPASSFATERVTVTLNPRTLDGVAQDVPSYTYRFFVSRPSDRAASPASLPARAKDASGVATQATSKAPQAATSQTATASQNGPRTLDNGVSVPSDFPRPVITVSKAPSPGHLFLVNRGEGAAVYTMILDNNGNPVWYRRGDGCQFKVQRNGVITSGVFTGVDKDFRWVADYSAAHGYYTDDHDLQVLEDGRYLLIGGRDQTVDMSRYIVGGTVNATVHETVLQEFTPAGEMILLFRAWDNYAVSDIEPIVEDPTAAMVRFPHMNAVDVDDDGHFLVSCRHLSEVTKIHRDAGQIVWRLGGAHSNFTFVKDPLNGFRNQHSVVALGHGHYLLFDNGNGHRPPVSRAVEYMLDLQKMTATLVWEFRDKPDRFAHYQGSVQRLPTGNTLINWVLPEYPKAVEVDPNGAKQFEMNLLPGSSPQWSFRCPWEGAVDVPYLIVEPQADAIALVFNKFGDPNVAAYRIYGGPGPNPTEVLQITQATQARLTRLDSGRRYYFRVTAVGTTGIESGFSNEESLIVRISPTAADQVLNGIFSQGKDNWTLEVQETASADWMVEDGAAHITIPNGGTRTSDVRLSQGGLQLVKDQSYALGFRAWADKARIVEVKLERGQAPHTDYGKIGYVVLTPSGQNFRYSVKMTDPTDYDVRILFNVGGSDIDVHLGDVFLKWNPRLL
jgi:hypothetical protein